MYLAIALMTIGLSGHPARAWQGMVDGPNPTPVLHVQGRFLQDPDGKKVTLHGYMQPGASWFNGQGRNFQQPGDYTSHSNVAAALHYYEAVADILSDPSPRYGQSHGWYCSYVRFIGDGSSVSNFAPGWDAAGDLSKPDQFSGWIENVVVPYIAYCQSRGLYVVLVGNPSETFPPGKDGKPDTTRNMSRQYQENLTRFWTTIASNPAIKNAPNVQFEICNEPIAIETHFGANDWGSGNDAYYRAIATFMQPIVDAIRAQGAGNIIWIPGLGWQGQYAGFAIYPVKGKNIGYAAHVYPAYGGAHDDVAKVKKLWDSNYKPCADRFPMIITEMSWNPNNGKGYQDLWNAHTSGFGDAIRACIDTESNVSFNIGMVGDMFGNLEAGLPNATLGDSEGTRAAWEWYPSYKSSAPGNNRRKHN